MKKVRVGIIGTGNIGTDLLIKIHRSEYLECAMFAGQNPNSPGIARAKKMGVTTSTKSINVFVDNPDICSIVFDATSAASHFVHAPILKKLGKFVIDMTPSRVGRMCVPTLNLDEALNFGNVNMITCGGQATTPIIKAIMEVHPEIEYVEIVASISSKSAGIGTRNNIDEYTQATSEGVKFFTGVKKSKAIIILNPAEPPIMMHNTIYAKIDKPDIKKLKSEIINVANKIKKYVPGYMITLGPFFENGRLTVMNEVKGKGDYLPVYAGNLDIINCAAIEVAQQYAKRKVLGK